MDSQTIYGARGSHAKFSCLLLPLPLLTLSQAHTVFQMALLLPQPQVTGACEQEQLTGGRGGD
eukprot:763241-Hanusia_phi.AAC.6